MRGKSLSGYGSCIFQNLIADLGVDTEGVRDRVAFDWRK
jgi:hypothetical protein